MSQSSAKPGVPVTQDDPAGLDQASPAAIATTQSHLFAVVAALIGAATLFLFFRQFFISGYDAIAGDLGDNRLLIAILEHWRHSFRSGLADFTSPNFFAPERGVLGYTDCVFLFLLPYSFARAVGLDYYLAFQVTLVALKAIGFAAMYLLLARIVRVNRWLALLGAVLFTLSNLYYVSVGHSQLMSVVFVPVMPILASSYHRHREQGNLSKARLFLGALAALEALLLFTSFYIGWFVLLTAATLAAVLGFAVVFKAHSLSPLRRCITELKRRRLDVAVALGVFVLALIPFLRVYLPTLKQTGGRQFAEILTYVAEPIDVVNVGGANALWGKWLFALRSDLLNRPGAFEKERGWPPGIVFAFIAAMAVCIRCSWKKYCLNHKREEGGSERFLLMGAVLGTACLLLWVMSLTYGQHSPWWVIARVVPGGSAIRVPVRINFVLNVLIIIVVSIGLQLLFLYLRSVGRRVAVIALLSTVLVCEQWNTAPTYWVSRASENRLLAAVHPAPRSCNTFYVTPSTNSRPFFATQIDAMLVAIDRGIPTINGYSGWLPVGWNLLLFGQDYVSQAHSWARQKGLAEGLCELDLGSGAWRQVGVLDEVRYRLGDVVDFTVNGNATRFKTAGWWQPEPGGSWTIGKSSTLTMNLGGPPVSDLWMAIEAHAFTPPSRPAFAVSVFVNDTKLASWMISNAEPVIRRQVRISKEVVRSGVVNITFINHDPRSPLDLGLSVDGRKVGLAMHTLTLRAVGGA